MLRVTHKFGRLEALGTYGSAGRLNDAADPVTLEVRVTNGDIETIIESLRMVPPNTRVFRLATGHWAADLDASLYVEGTIYTVHFRYEMTPGNLKVDRFTFTHRDPMPIAHDADKCAIYGTAVDMLGAPIAQEDVTVETYKDIVTMTKRTGQRTIRTDVFGNWSVDLPKEILARFVLGEAAKIVRVPTTNRSSLAAIPAFQPADAGQKDRFGYKYP